jgi:hypothetical protein
MKNNIFAYEDFLKEDDAQNAQSQLAVQQAEAEIAKIKADVEVAKKAGETGDKAAKINSLRQQAAIYVKMGPALIKLADALNKIPNE